VQHFERNYTCTVRDKLHSQCILKGLQYRYEAYFIQLKHEQSDTDRNACCDLMEKGSRTVMRTVFPDFLSLTMGNGSNGHLEAVGLGREERPYLAAWRAPSTGNWMIPSYNILSFQQTRYAALWMGNGNDGQLQVIGLGLEDNQAYLVAWQDTSGHWNSPDQQNSGPLRPGWTFSTLAMGNGNDGQLQVIGLGLKDRQAYLVAWQDTSGHWNSPDQQNSGPLRPGWTFSTLAVGNDNDGQLQVIGLGLEDDQAYLVAWQDTSGLWNSPDQQNSGPLRPGWTFSTLAMGKGNNGQLQVIGLGLKDQQAYLVAWQDTSGHWNSPDQKYSGSLRPGWTFLTLAVGNGNDCQLQVIGLGLKDRQAYLVAWQDTSGCWNFPTREYSGPLGILVDSGYMSLVLCKSSDGILQVAAVTISGTPYLVAWLSVSGAWTAGRSLSQSSDTGRWNPRIPDVRAAYDAVAATGQHVSYSVVPTVDDIAHIQGMARYERYYMLTHNRSTGSNGYILLIDIIKRTCVQTFATPEDDHPHPGGCQVIGDYLALPVENSDNEDGIVRFYWLGSMSDNEKPTLLPPKILQGGSAGAGAAAITDVGTGVDRRYLMAIYDDGAATFYLSNDCLLDDPDLKFTLVLNARLDPHGADNLFLLTNAKGEVYLIGLSSVGETFGFEDWADLYQLRISLGAWTFSRVASRHVYTEGFPGGLAGIHFRFGACAEFVNSTELNFSCTCRNVEPIGYVYANLFPSVRQPDTPEADEIEQRELPLLP